MSTSPLYDIEVELIDKVDGNIFALIGEVRQKLSADTDASPAMLDQFVDEVRSADSYNEALLVLQSWVHVT